MADSDICGVCDLCGQKSDGSVQECNILSCTFQHCEGGLYHQECLEKYLKSNKLEKNRKTGFKCPRGCGKGTRFDQACPGRIDKSHPIHPRNEDKKKTKLAAVVVEPPRPAKPAATAAPSGKPPKAPKEEAKADAAAKASPSAPAKPAAAAKASASTASAAAAPAAAPAKAAKKEPAVVAPRPEAVAKQRLQETVAAMRREIGLTSTSTGMHASGSKGDLQSLAGGAPAPAKAAAAAAAAPSAWGKPATPTPEPPAVGLQQATISQLPQLQQLLQQAQTKKPAGKGAAAAAAAAAAKPAPAVPAPVLNPPTPVWPALGAAQTTAAAALAASAQPTPATHSSGEGTARPASPLSAWGAAAAPAPAPPPTAPLTRAGGTAAVAGGDSGSAAAEAEASGQPAAAPAPAEGALAHEPAGPAAAATASPSPSPPPAARHASARAAADAASLAPASTLAAAAAAVAVPPPRAGPQLVGAEYRDEEAKEQKLTKAQRKNLKRTEKKKAPTDAPHGGAEGLAELGGRSGGGADGGDASHSGRGAGAAASRARDAGASSGGAGRARAGPTSGSSDDPEHAHIAEAEEAAVMEELCINSIVARKVLNLITRLQRLGVPEFVAAAAVQRHGSNVMGSLEWLLVAGADAANAPPEAVLTAAAESSSAAESEIDISEELQQLGDVQSAMGVPTELLQQCVLDCSGDVQTAANMVMERLLSAPSSSSAAGAAAAAAGAAAAASTAGAVAGADAPSTSRSSGSGSGMRGGAPLSNGAPLAGSLAAGAGGVDAEAGLSAADALYGAPWRQPRHADPQEDPLAAASGRGRGGQEPLLEGWQNGFAQAPLLGGGAAAPGAGAGGARSTSRLLHWLRDDTGRVAALEEDTASSGGAGAGAGASSSSLSPRNGLLLDSPFAAHLGGLRSLAATSKATSESPSLHSWLGSNGYHPAAAGGVHGGCLGAAAGLSQELYAQHSGAFSFHSALSKPTPSMMHSAGVDALGDARWGVTGQRQGGHSLLVSSAPGTDSHAHNDGGSELASAWN